MSFTPPRLVPGSTALHGPPVTHSPASGPHSLRAQCPPHAGVRGKDQDTQGPPPQEGLMALGARTGKQGRGLPPGGETQRPPGDQGAGHAAGNQPGP